MPTAITLREEAPPIAYVDELHDRKRWTRDDCEFLERSGLLTERYELIDGEIIILMGQKRPHIMGFTRLFVWLASVFPQEHIQGQGTTEVARADRKRNRPEPDAAVLARPDYEYTKPPTGEDILLAVEVSDTTLRRDLGYKTGLYARAGIMDYWVLDVLGRRLIVHRQPVAGRYMDVQTITEADEDGIAPLAQPDATVHVSRLLPPVLITPKDE